MKSKQQQIADMWQIMANNPKAYFKFKVSFEKWRKTEGSPDITSNLDEWCVHIPLKPHPLEKYIELDLDMEFASVNSFHLPVINKLISIDDKTYNSDIDAEHCRLKPNHVHWWGGKSSINPIPDNCRFRVFYKNSNGFGAWADCRYSDNVNWKDILMFEILYTEENDND